MTVTVMQQVTRRPCDGRHQFDKSAGVHGLGQLKVKPAAGHTDGREGCGRRGLAGWFVCLQGGGLFQVKLFEYLY